MRSIYVKLNIDEETYVKLTKIKYNTGKPVSKVIMEIVKDNIDRYLG